MRPIKIYNAKMQLIEGADTAIQEALDAINGKATAFTIDDAGVVMTVATDAEDMLKAHGLPIKERAGSMASYTPPGPSASSYRYGAKSTEVTLHRRASGWYLIDVSSAKVFPKSPARDHVHVTEEQAAAIARRAVAKFSVMRSAA